MDISPAYQAALDYLYSFIDYSLTRQENLSPEKFDLARMHAFMAVLGDPHKKYPVIHVAGSKGKGSVVAYCAAALHEEGYKVGMNTSPHMQEFTERIQVDGREISPEEVVELVEFVKPHVVAVPELTTFEITTALAFLYFAWRTVDVAVIEVGLGGRLDATNVVAPLVSVITSLSYEHTQILGDTLAEIAGEKAGIIKDGVPVVVAPQEMEALNVLERVAEERHARIVKVGEDYPFEALARSLDGQSLKVRDAGGNPGLPVELDIGLLGPVQVENAAVAYAALQVARQQGLAIREEAIQRGFDKTVWPGRFEIFSRSPYLILDGAHNQESAAKLAQALDEYFPDAPVVLLLGVSADKDLRAIFDELLPRASHLIATRSTHPRAMEPELILAQAEPYSRPAFLAPTIEEAIEQALRLVEDGGIIVATGSVFVAGAARAVWAARQDAPSR